MVYYYCCGCIRVLQPRRNLINDSIHVRRFAFHAIFFTEFLKWWHAEAKRAEAR